MAKGQKMTKTNTTHFNIQRKIVANMTTESWANIPHVTYNYEPDVTEFMFAYKRLNEGCTPEEKITLNTLMLRIIVEGIKANPVMNSHIEFDQKLVRGEINTYEDINISLPMVLPTGEMMTINLHNFESKDLDDMTAYMADVNRRIANTDLTEVMFDVSLDNTLTALKQGKVKQTINRLIGSKTGKHKVKTLSGKAKKEYYKIPEGDRLTKHDIEQGTITVSNIGSVYREQRGATCLLEIIPPQICAIAVGAVQDRPVVITNDNGEKEIAIRQIMPLCIAFDHRALDFGEIVPFIKKLDEIFEAPEVILNWRKQEADKENIEELKTEIEEREEKFKRSKERDNARKEAEETAKKAERDAKLARRKAEKAQKEAEEQEKKILREQEEKAKKAEKALKEAEEKEKKILREQEEKAKKEEKARREAEEKAKKEAEKEAKAKAEAEEKLRKAVKESEEKAQKEAAEQERKRLALEEAKKAAEEAKRAAEEAALKAEEAKQKIADSESEQHRFRTDKCRLSPAGQKILRDFLMYKRFFTKRLVYH